MFRKYHRMATITTKIVSKMFIVQAILPSPFAPNLLNYILLPICLGNTTVWQILQQKL